jgi:hypothetical protein
MRLTKFFLAGLFALVAGLAHAQTPVGPPNQVICNNIAILTAGPATITQIQAASGTARIFICGWHVTNTGATGTFSLSTGTGSNCGTGTATLLPPQNVTSTAPSADHIDYAHIQTPQGVALCITPSVATIAAVVYFAQF